MKGPRERNPLYLTPSDKLVRLTLLAFQQQVNLSRMLYAVDCVLTGWAV
jgi:hypothetical protein